MRVCGVIVSTNIEELTMDLKKAEKAGADLIEVRLDFLQEKPDLESLRRRTKLPLIATNRSRADGGRASQPQSERVRLLFDAAQAGFDYIDLELSSRNLTSLVERVHRLGSKTIVSWHDFNRTPNGARLERLVASCRHSGAEISKIVTTASKIEDNLSCLNFVQRSSRRGHVIAFCMGRLGILSRLLSPLFGSEFTYASVAPGKQAAPGQVTLSEMGRAHELLGVR